MLSGEEIYLRTNHHGLRVHVHVHFDSFTMNISGIITLNPAPDNTRFGERRPNPVTVDPNQIFGQPPAWSNYPQVVAPITPPPGISNYPHYPPNPNNNYMGQFPPPPYYGGTKQREPSLIHQFLNNKKNTGTRATTSTIQLTLLAGISFIAFKLLLFC